MRRQFQFYFNLKQGNPSGRSCCLARSKWIKDNHNSRRSDELVIMQLNDDR